MGEVLSGSGIEFTPHTYYYDGNVRRKLHEYGANGINFYNKVLEGMEYRPGDIALDVGAGIGDDGRNIAWRYRPRLVFLLEPRADHESLEDFDDRYISIATDLKRRGLSGVQLLPSSELDITVQELNNPDSTLLRPRMTYLQPIPAVAEAIPLPDKSVTKLSMIHSIYAFYDVQAALSEAARVMTDGATGVVVTNGPSDKLVFKDILHSAKMEFDREAPEGIQYTAPQTVSSRLGYIQAETLLKDFFEEVWTIPYKDTMIITPEREPEYIYSYNSYKGGFDPPIINQGRWARVRQKVLEERMAAEMVENNDVFKDTIDIAAVFFRRPKK